MPHGQNHPKAKLTDQDIEFIWANYGWRAEPDSGKMSAATLAKKFNVNPQTINRIVNGQHWKGKQKPRQTIEPRSRKILISDCRTRKIRKDAGR
jgi:hypothetical protein